MCLEFRRVLFRSGMCFVACPQNAKEIRNDVNVVKEWINNGHKVVASLAPSFIVNYSNTNFEGIKSALKQLGFYDVEETSIGATLVKNEYDRMMNEDPSQVLISSCCPSINNLIQKYYTEAVSHLASVVSPM